MNIIVTGGGTGGHVFPGIAIARLLRETGHHVEYVGAIGGAEERLVPPENIPLHLLNVTGVKGKGIIKKIASLLRLPLSLVKAAHIIRQSKAEAVIGVGGFASFPTVLMGRLLGCRVVVCEQNSVPGLTNRLLGRFAHHVALSIQGAESYFPEKKGLLTGNPVRQVLFQVPEHKPGADFRILVLGGSLGARVLNEGCPVLFSNVANTIDRTLSITHQCGRGDVEQIKNRYAEHGLEQVEVHAFIQNMNLAYTDADLVVCRAGATTVAELGAVARPAIFVPFAKATDDHQTHNARSIVSVGGAEMIHEDALKTQKAATLLKTLIDNPAQLSNMAAAMAKTARPNATHDIVDLVVGKEQAV